MKSLKKIFKKKPVKQIADWSLWHELRRRELKERFNFKSIGIGLKTATIAMRGFSQAMKNVGYTTKDFNES